MQKTGEPLGLSTEPLFGEYLINALMECGATKVVAMLGETALSWADINDYAEATGEIQEAWERKIVKRLSEKYVLGKSQGRNPLSINPAFRDNEED